MSKTNLIVLAIAVVALVTSVASYLTHESPKLGNVVAGGELIGTSTDSTWATPFFQNLKDGYGMLGSVLVTLTSNAPLCIYDATTTNATQRTNTATTTLICFKTTTVGNYAVNTRFMYGLTVDVKSTVGIASTTITWR